MGRETNKHKRKPYPSDVTDAEWAFVAPYLTLMKEDAPQRDYSLREVFNGLRWMVRGGTTWRMIPHDLRKILREVLSGLHFLAFAILMLRRFAEVIFQSA